MAQDWREQRIAEFAAALAASEAAAANDEQIAEFEQHVAELSGRMAKLAEKWGKIFEAHTGRRPVDPPAARRQRRGKGKSKSRRKRGAQPEHRPEQRRLRPPEDVDDVFPFHCEGCAKPLPEVPDPNAMRFQVTEVLPSRPTRPISQTRRAVIVRAHDLRGARPATRFPVWPETDGFRGIAHAGLSLSRRKAAELLGQWPAYGARSALSARSKLA